MKKEEFVRLQEKAKNFLYSSFHKLDAEYTKYQLLQENDYLLAIIDQKQKIIYWASNYPSLVIDEAKLCKEPVKVSSIPEKWKTEFTLAGFEVCE